MDTCWVPRPLPARAPAMTLRPDPCGGEASREHRGEGGAGRQPPRGPEAGPGRRGSRGRGRDDGGPGTGAEVGVTDGGGRRRVRNQTSPLPPSPRGPSPPIGQRPGLRLKPLCPPPEGCTSGAARGRGAGPLPAAARRSSLGRGRTSAGTSCRNQVPQAGAATGPRSSLRGPRPERAGTGRRSGHLARRWSRGGPRPGRFPPFVVQAGRNPEVGKRCEKALTGKGAASGHAGRGVA